MDGPLASVARGPSTLPRRYPGQLCKHFQHRLPVVLTVDTGSIGFPLGPCVLAAEADALVMRVEAADAEGLATLQKIVATSGAARVPG